MPYPSAPYCLIAFSVFYLCRWSSEIVLVVYRFIYCPLCRWYFTPSTISRLSQLQKLLPNCERVLAQLDMAINSKKSCCLGIGQRYNNPCAPLCTLFGDLTSWVDELRYLGVIIMRSRACTCSLNHAKKLFCRSANTIFGEVGRIV